jgi:heat shock protein HslJ
MAENQKVRFLEKKTVQLEMQKACYFNNLASRPSLTRQLYDQQLNTKGLLLSSSLKFRHRLRRLADTVLKKKYLIWDSLTNQISKFGSEVRLLAANGRVVARLQTMSARPETGLNLYGKSWTLVSLNGQALDAQSARPHVTFEANRISGATGSNQFSGLHQRTDGKSRFLNMAQTERACLAAIGDPMATEAAFMAALSQVDQIRLTGNQLTLKSSGSSDVLVFEAGN